jgi:phage baseplate assembly protein W
MSNFLGAPYPIFKHPLGLLHTTEDVTTIKGDLLTLLLTNPLERVMLPTYGTPLNKILFEPNDSEIITEVRNMIINSINTWEPRIVVQDINVNVTNTAGDVTPSLDATDPKEDLEHILLIQISFSDFEDITQINELTLEVPLGA